MDTNNLVSVVIPVYNSEKFLVECINSVLNQTYKEIEIICVDDGSTDSSLEILKKYGKKISIISQKNQGLASALNAGIEILHGTWFKWFSPDDVLNSNAIEELVKEAQNFGKSYIIYSNWEIIDEYSKHLRNFLESNYNDLEADEFNVRLLDGQQINVNTSLIPVWIFEKGCVFRELKDPVLIDYDFFLRSALFHGIKFHLIEKFLIKYRINKFQLSHKTISKSLSNLHVVRKSILTKLDFEEKEKLENLLGEFQKNKPFSKKSMEFSLKILKKTLPENITDKILLLYLNKIRRTR
jgi:glycosyltransferase involved in cell wall biosynthesis